MRMIKCHIDCKQKDYSETQKEMGIEQETEFRPGRIFIDKIIHVTEHSAGGCIVECIEENILLIRESLEEFDQLIELANEFQLTSSN